MGRRHGVTVQQLLLQLPVVLRQQKYAKLCELQKASRFTSPGLSSPAPTVSLTRNIKKRELWSVGFGLDDLTGFKHIAVYPLSKWHRHIHA